MKTFPCCIANANGAPCSCGKSDADVLLRDMRQALKEREAFKEHILYLWATISANGNANATVGLMRREMQGSLRAAIDNGLVELKIYQITTNEASNSPVRSPESSPTDLGGAEVKP